MSRKERIGELRRFPAELEHAVAGLADAHINGVVGERRGW